MLAAFCLQQCSNQRNDRPKRGRRRRRWSAAKWKAETETKSRDQKFSTLLQAEKCFCWLHLSPFLLVAPRKSRNCEELLRRGLHLSEICSSICPSVVQQAPCHCPLPPLGFVLMTHSPPGLLLYRSRRCVSESKQCSPVDKYKLHLPQIRVCSKLYSCLNLQNCHYYGKK